MEFDPWIEAHVEQWFDAEMAIRSTLVLAGKLPQEEGHPDVVRRQLRERLIAAHDRPIPGELNELLATFGDLQANKAPAEAWRPAIEQWNERWRRYVGRDQGLPPSLRGVDLEWCKLHGIDLSDADLRRLEDGHHGMHDGVVFSGAFLEGANFSGCNLGDSDFENADLTRAFFDDAHAWQASFRGAKWEATSARGAMLKEADFSRASIEGADFRGATLHLAKFDEATLLFPLNFLVDENSVFRTRFASRSNVFMRAFLNFYLVLRWVGTRVGFAARFDRRPVAIGEDPWSTLRRTYTGPNFFITMLLLVAFVVPYVAHAIFLSQVSRAELALLPKVEAILGEDVRGQAPTPAELQQLDKRLRGEIEAMRAALTETRVELERARAALGIGGAPAVERLQHATSSVQAAVMSVQTLERQAAAFRNDSRRFLAGSLRAKRYPLWQIVLGLDTRRFGWTILVVTLFIFNGLRWFLTITVAPMRDAEERGFVTPAILDYRFLIPLHRIASTLFWVSFAAGVWTFLEWMAMPVYKFW